MRTAHSLLRLVSILLDLAQDALQFLLLGTRSSAALKAENIFLRKQLALYLEREAKSRRATDATRLSMVLLSRLFAWQNALINVKPGPSSAGIGRVFSCSGDGSRDREGGPACPGNFGN
jgi:hypothetical protein